MNMLQFTGIQYEKDVQNNTKIYVRIHFWPTTFPAELSLHSLVLNYI